VEILPEAEFQYNNTYHESIGMSPFKATYGYNANINGQPIQGIEGSSKDLVENITAIQTELKSTMLLAQERMKKYYDQHSSTQELKEGDKVWLKHENFTTDRPSQKLDHKWMGPYKILQKHSELAYRLELPITMKIHPVFNIDKLTKWTKDEIPGREPKRPAPTVVAPEGNEWEVEEIDNSRYFRNKLQYHVKWKEYGYGEDPWQPAENLLNAPQLIEEFHNQNPKAAGPKLTNKRKRKKANKW
jgi:hypothetical protein